MKNKLATNQIIDAVCQATGFTFPELVKPCRKKRVVAARQVLQYILKEECKIKPAAVAVITKRDRSTVLHNSELIKDMLKTRNLSYVRVYNKITKAIKLIEA